MIERLARILCEYDGIDPDGANSVLNDAGDRYPAGSPHWKHKEAFAREIIAALREPTEAMIEAGRAEAGTEEFGMRRAYQAMMDEARK